MKATQQWRLSSVGGVLGNPAAAFGGAMQARRQIFEHSLSRGFVSAVKCDETNK